MKTLTHLIQLILIATIIGVFVGCSETEETSLNLAANPSTSVEAGQEVTVSAGGTFKSGSQVWKLDGIEQAACAGQGSCNFSSDEAASADITVDVKGEEVESGGVDGLTGNQSSPSDESKKIRVIWAVADEDTEKNTEETSVDSSNGSSTVPSDGTISQGSTGDMVILDTPIGNIAGGNLNFNLTGDNLPSTSLTATVNGETCQWVTYYAPSGYSGIWMAPEFSCSFKMVQNVSEISFSASFEPGTTLVIYDKSQLNSPLKTVVWN